MPNQPPKSSGNSFQDAFRVVSPRSKPDPIVITDEWGILVVHKDKKLTKHQCMRLERHMEDYPQKFQK